MGHDIHFLERLDRVHPEHQALALSIYRNPAQTRRIIAALSEGGKHPRVAIALEDGGQGPYVIVTNTGRFVTCLARGMALGPLPLLSRAMLDADVEWRRRLAEDSAQGSDFLAQFVRIGESRWPRRDEMEPPDRLVWLCIDTLYRSIDKSYEDIEQLEATLVGRRRSTRRNLRAMRGKGTVYEESVAMWARLRAQIAHQAILFTLGLRDGDPLRKEQFERDVLRLLVVLVGNQGSPAHMLRAAWMLIQREALGMMEELRTEDEEDSPPLCLESSEFMDQVLWCACLGRMLNERGEADALLKRVEELSSRPESQLYAERTLWCWRHRHLPLAERARLLAAHEYTTIPRWAARFYSPDTLARSPESMTQALLGLDEALFMEPRESALLWLYIPEIAPRRAAQLYPVEQRPIPTPRDQLARNEALLDLYVRAFKPPVIVEDKQGRNAPCACGSGKKYKKCCAQQEA